MSNISSERPTRGARWERATEWPLTVAAVLFLAAYAVPILDPTEPGWLLDACRSISWITWCFFGIDIVVRVALADRRMDYLLRHWYQVIIMILPLLRPLRMLRVIPLLGILNRHARIHLRGRVLLYVVGGALLLVFVAALAVLDAERSSPDANIVDFDDAIWWAVTTMTTVGYGDRHPVTGIGRLVAFGLMVGGIALLGTVTATLSSWLVEAVAAENKESEDMLAILHRLESRIAELEPGSTSSVPSRSDESPRTHEVVSSDHPFGE